MKKIYSVLLMLSLGFTAAWATSPATITFSELGLENSVQYTDPFDIDDNVTITFGGGSNDGKYYNTGTGIRTYGGGTITIAAASGSITDIAFTWDGGNKPTAASVANVGTYSVDAATWTGSAESVVLTRPSGSGHWRLKAVTVTYDAGGVAASAITATPASVTIPGEGIELGEVAVSYTGISDMDLVAEVVLYNDEACTDLFTGDWFTAAYNADKSAIEYIASANTGDARSIYMYLFAIDDNAESVEKIIAVSQDAYVAPFASLPFAFDGGKADIAKTSGMWHKGLDADYAASPKLKFNTTGDSLIIAINAQPGAFSFDIKGNSFADGTFSVLESADGETYTTVADYTGLTGEIESKSETLAATTRYILFVYTNKVTGNVGLGNISIAAAASGTDIENISSSLQGGERGRLIINNGQLYILRGEHMYNAAGAMVK